MQVARTFLAVAGLIFVTFGSLFLLFPEASKKISEACNRTVLAVDERIHTRRKPAALLMLVLSVVFWYISFTD